MPRYKDYNYGQMKMIPVSYEKQILPGTFEYSLSRLIDEEVDLGAFDEFYSNDDGGRPAYDPRFKDHKAAKERSRRTDRQRFARTEFGIDRKKKTAAARPAK